ncbi:uncharacterized protein LOC136080007 [Hydra vulgaris]|uniref:Uncharacterized protein LOC136080007 n=1 Tax=Hydra vulgaris TaxID=6087 RepID=A0ABM4BU76_HYDVU
MDENSSCSKSAPNSMRWTGDHDVFFLREILLHEPYQFKKGSIERGKNWEKIASVLNSTSQLFFKVKSRAVRDRLNVLIENHKKKTRDEEKASGIDVIESEVDIAVADLIDRFKEADEAHTSQSDAKKLKEVDDHSKAAEMRKRSMETLSETNERNKGKACKRTRNNGSETIIYLREKGERDAVIKKEELELKKQSLQNHCDMLKLFQQQQTMMQEMVQQQSQQQASMVEIIKQLSRK